MGICLSYSSVRRYSVLDNIPEDCVAKKVDNKADQAIADCLHNFVILRKIMQNFSNEELLELSCVNKQWNYEARSEMRTRGNLIARLNFGHNCQCQNLKAFGESLKQMNVVPFSGMSIKIEERDHLLACRKETMGPVLGVALDRLMLKKASIELAGHWWKNKHCAGFVLAKTVLQYFSRTLEELTLYIGSKREEFIQEVLQDCHFPRLRVLKLEELYGVSDEAYTNYMVALVSRARMLQELHTRGPVNLMENVLKERPAAVHVHKSKVRAPFDEIPESVISTLRLKSMQLECTSDPDFSCERFTRITPMLLQASCTTTLRHLQIEAVLALPLMCYGICFRSLRNLEMIISLDQFDADILKIVKAFDFTRIFPNLDKVKIVNPVCVSKISPDQMSRFIEETNAISKEPMRDRAVNIKELCLLQNSYSSSTIQYFGEMFPNIEKLQLNAYYSDSDIPFGSVWEHWIRLKEIEVISSAVGRISNLDSVFCGIFPEEAARLRKKNEKYLESVNIVPVMPDITCLKDLRTLTITYPYHNICNLDVDSKSVFSKVTRLIAFARCTNSLSIS